MALGLCLGAEALIALPAVSAITLRATKKAFFFQSGRPDRRRSEVVTFNMKREGKEEREEWSRG